MEIMTCAENDKEGYDRRDIRGALPDTIPILTSAAVQIDGSIKSQVTSIEAVWVSWIVII